MRSRRRLLAVATSAAVFMLGACGSSDSSGTSDSGGDSTLTGDASFDGVTLRVGNVTGGEFIWAVETSNVFDDAPYEVEFVDFDTSPDMIAALASGAIDIAPIVQIPALVAAQGNAETAWTADDAPIRVVAAWANPEEPGWAVVARDLEATDLADLDGKSVTYSRGAFGQVYWLTLGKQSDVSGVEQVQLPFLDGLSAFREGSVDAVITNNRNAMSMEAKGEGVVVHRSADTIDYIGATVVGAQVLQSEQMVAVIDEFLDRVARAYAWSLDNVDVLSKYFVEKMKVEPGVAKSFARYEYKEEIPFDPQLIENLRQVVEALVEGGVIPQSVDPLLALDRRFE